MTSFSQPLLLAVTLWESQGLLIPSKSTCKAMSMWINRCFKTRMERHQIQHLTRATRKIWIVQGSSFLENASTGKERWTEVELCLSINRLLKFHLHKKFRTSTSRRANYTRCRSLSLFKSKQASSTLKSKWTNNKPRKQTTHRSSRLQARLQRKCRDLRLASKALIRRPHRLVRQSINKTKSWVSTCRME